MSVFEKKKLKLFSLFSFKLNVWSSAGSTRLSRNTMRMERMPMPWREIWSSGANNRQIFAFFLKNMFTDFFHENNLNNTFGFISHKLCRVLSLLTQTRFSRTPQKLPRSESIGKWSNFFLSSIFRFSRYCPFLAVQCPNLDLLYWKFHASLADQI